MGAKLAGRALLRPFETAVSWGDAGALELRRAVPRQLGVATGGAPARAFLKTAVPSSACTRKRSCGKACGSWRRVGGDRLSALAATCRRLSRKLGTGLRRAFTLRNAGCQTDRSSSPYVARRRAAIRLAHRIARRELLEPRHALCARVGFFDPTARKPTACRLPAPERLPPARPRPRRRVRPLRRRTRPDIGHRSGLRAQYGAVPGRQRPARPARAEPLRPPRRRHGTRHVRLGRSRVGRSAARRVTPRHVPPSERHEQRRVPRDAASHPRARDDRPRRRPLGLELAHATPRAWLAPGKRIAVRGMPTSFGPVSYTIDVRRTSHPLSRSTSPPWHRSGRSACDSACPPARGSPPSRSTDGPTDGSPTARDDRAPDPDRASRLVVRVDRASD